MAGSHASAQKPSSPPPVTHFAAPVQLFVALHVAPLTGTAVPPASFPPVGEDGPGSVAPVDPAGADDCSEDEQATTTRSDNETSEAVKPRRSMPPWTSAHRRYSMLPGSLTGGGRRRSRNRT